MHLKGKLKYIAHGSVVQHPARAWSCRVAVLVHPSPLGLEGVRSGAVVWCCVLDYLY